MDSGRESGRGRKSQFSPYFSNKHGPAFAEQQALVPFQPPVTIGHPVLPVENPPSESIRQMQVVEREPISMKSPQLAQNDTPALAGPLGTASGFQIPLHLVQNDTPALAGPSGTGAGFPSSFQSSPQSGSQPTPFELPSVMSPWARGIPNALVPPRYGIGSPSFSVPTKASQIEKALDSVALPSEMPIGSDVHLQSPPAYGVIKIANIPYSITQQEIVQFIGRHSHLITPDKGSAIHIIMERSTAKTMDCYAEFDTQADALEAVDRINRICETGRAPRLGNRHVDVEASSQDALLKDLFPRAKCVAWRNGVPTIVANTDPYSSGFTGFFTSEEIHCSIRHAEMPQRSPFSAKCPQRTYESTISTIGKFPWFATGLYTVNDRNSLFELVNRQILALTARINSAKKTMGLDQRLLRELLYAGLGCPAFNGRMKFTLCVNSENEPEIGRFQDMGKYFPFDTLVKLADFDDQTFLYYVNLLSKGNFQPRDSPGLPNSYPLKHPALNSPYGKIWFEWPRNLAKSKIWEDAVQHEMVILCNLVISGWIEADQERKSNLESLRKSLPAVPDGPVGSSSGGNENVSPHAAGNHRAGQPGPSLVTQASRRLGDIHETPSRRAGNGCARLEVYETPTRRADNQRSLTEVRAGPSRRAGDSRLLAGAYETPSRRAGDGRAPVGIYETPFRRGGDARSLAAIYATPSRRVTAANAAHHRLDPFSGVPNPVAEDNSSPIHSTRPPSAIRDDGSFGHRNARSSPNYRPSIVK